MSHNGGSFSSDASSATSGHERERPKDGEALHRAGLLQEAAEAYRHELVQTPDDARTLSNYGGLLCTLGDFQEAHDVLIRALNLKPTLVDAWSNFGNALLAFQRYDDAIAAYKECLTRYPQHVLALSNLGVALDRRGEHALARNFHRVAVRLDPENAESHANYAICLLALGEYQEGFEEYEWRWKTRMLGHHRMTAPLWEGGDFTGRTLLIHTEGGFGDMLQFSRFIPFAAQFGGRTLVRVRKELLSLFRLSFPDQTFISIDDPVPPHDLQCPAASLPRALGTTLETIPSPGGFLKADPQKVAFWAEKLEDDLEKRGLSSAPLRVGLVWAGAPHRGVREVNIADQRRSTDLATLTPLAAVPNTLFYSLQIGEKSVQAKTPPAGMQLIDHTPLLHDFSGTAAFVSNLDLVIAVDTSTAHVAAGLGKPVWMLSRYDQCWRWLSGRSDSPWYDSLRIYQQNKPLDWADPMHRITADLAKFARAWGRT
ncbi:glycosyltransferase family protein [Gluconacetobacter diazotrophicus]|uniref:Glycosyltransferase family protein n=1 Tax=Gluconacetobacter diazotrophicus TaxID=33996 RepID=A0A7W4I499_GLUDI|nr:tetratricopeptide repeat-containing glycosyltransferase family protein [Gluconacetobacter diazotrophicus]MBB2155928.1 glycosyltransferase family protein [Gluconacetobacter diazotrophicus]